MRTIKKILLTIARQKKIPYKLTTAEADPFFSETNQARLAHSKVQIAEGKIIYKTPQELGLDSDL
ncbi:hypothetical protein FACS189490_12670 [Clostridia bacterium]|nr:hypothetical protein FACS189490_12670 [Clostridia bacterium]